MRGFRRLWPPGHEFLDNFSTFMPQFLDRSGVMPGGQMHWHVRGFHPFAPPNATAYSQICHGINPM